jgi:tetratricopeptide (TPR) repeat protein
LEDIEKAVESYLKVINEYPEVTSVDVQKLSIGIFFQDIKMYDLAMKAYNQVAKATQEPEIKIEAQFYIADTLEESGDFQKALLEFLKVTYMDFSPKNIWILTAKFRVAQIYESLGEWEKALKFYQGICDLLGGGDPRCQQSKERIDQINEKLQQ